MTTQLTGVIIERSQGETMTRTVFKTQSRTRNWLAIYSEWKAKHPNAAKDDRVWLVQGCKSKFAHPNFLSAMLAANSLRRDFGIDRFAIYKCPLCKMQHITKRRGKGGFHFPEDSQ